MYIDDPIGRALGLPPLTEPLPPPNIVPFNTTNAPPWNKGLTGLGGYTLSEQHKIRISLGMISSDKCSPPPEVRQKISNKLKGRTDYMARGSRHYSARKVLHIESGIIYGSMTEASRSCNVTSITVKRWCKAHQEGKVISRTGKFKGITFRYVD